MSESTSMSRLAASATSFGVIALALGLVTQGVPQAVVGALPSQPEVVIPSFVSAEAPVRQVVCAGPFLGFVQQETTPRGFGEPTVNLLGSAFEQIPLASEDLLDVYAGTEGKIAALPMYAQQDANAGFLAGSSASTIDTPFARGYEASICQTPASESWLVAGSTTTGRNSVVSLANPGTVQSIVDLELFGQTGIISAPAARGILLQPGERRVFSLSGLAPDESSPVIRIQSSGTPVTASLHVSLTRGLQPDGLDVATTQLPPSTTRIVPGLWLESEEQLGSVLGIEGYGDVGPILRLLSPDADSSATISLVRPVNGDVSIGVDLQAGRVFDVSLDELGQGWASVRIDADQPIVAGIRHSSVGDNKTDLAWLPSAALIEGLGNVVVPRNIEAVLQMASASDEPLTVTFARVSDDGQTVLAQGSQALNPGQFSARGLGSQGGNYLFETTGPVALSIALIEAGSIATLPVVAPPPDLPEVSVFAR